jgi:hypothetical protein
MARDEVPYQSFLQRMEPIVDGTLKNLSEANFRADPLGGKKYSRITSIISSAYKRHGQILGRALLERLLECSKFVVWTEAEYKLPHSAALEYARRLPPEAYRGIQIAYGDEDRSIPVDVLVFNKETGALKSYNVKRGNGPFDGGKRRQLLEELIKTQITLKSYGELQGYSVKEAESYVIFYYGVCSAPACFSLIGEQLDDHFGFPVSGAIEALNGNFRSKLYKLIEM